MIPSNHAFNTVQFELLFETYKFINNPQNPIIWISPAQVFHVIEFVVSLFGSQGPKGD